MKNYAVGILLMLVIRVNAQDTTASLAISGYTEMYYQYDFNKPADNNRPGFIYSHNRHNEFNLDLGFLKAAYNTPKIRANLALAAGTYMNANYAAEPGVLKNVFEANAGIKLGPKNVWLDVGILPSHIGFESAVSKDCWTLTRSIGADNTPYFEAGAKLTYTTSNGKWMLGGMALNGWQRIKRVDGNSLLSWGTQVQFKPSAKVLLNYSNFFGTDKPDNARLYRIFHNFYGIFTPGEKWGLVLGFDAGTEEKAGSGPGHNYWYSPVGILRYTINSKWVLTGRVEYYQDQNGVIISTGTPHGFQTGGWSLNIDHRPLKNVLVRLEARRLASKDKIFIRETGLVKTNSSITSSVAVSF